MRKQSREFIKIRFYQKNIISTDLKQNRGYTVLIFSNPHFGKYFKSVYLSLNYRDYCILHLYVTKFFLNFELFLMDPSLNLLIVFLFKVQILQNFYYSLYYLIDSESLSESEAEFEFDSRMFNKFFGSKFNFLRLYSVNYKLFMLYNIFQLFDIFWSFNNCCFDNRLYY